MFPFSWFRRRRRRKLVASPFPVQWAGWLERLPFYAGLTADERGRLHAILRVILAEKRWEGCAGLELTDEMKVVISAQAALLLLEIEHDHYARVRSILVYPTAYGQGAPRRHQDGIVGEGGRSAGEAWYRGPVVLSWDSALQGAVDPKDGHNLVWHEFAHKLDMMDGYVDGTPRLHRREDYKLWTRIMTAEFENLKDRGGRRSVLDRYGATNEAEFFAVATEAFFEKSLQMEKKHPELYDLLRSYYRQDPAERLRKASRDAEGPAPSEKE